MRMLAGAIAAVALILSLQGVAAAQAVPEMSDSCVHDATITSLQQCVQHAFEQGYIDNEGVARSLQAEVSTAEAAVDKGQIQTAINALQTFISEVSAQNGVHIAEPHATHLVMHATIVIDALQAQIS